MPPIGSIVGQDWLNQNATRKYPLSDDASGRDTTGDFELPNDFIVDAVIPISTSSAYDPDGFHLSEIAIFGQGVVASFSYTDPGTLIPTLIGKISVASTHIQNATYFMVGIAPFQDVIAKITIGSLESILRLGGVYTFDRAGGKLLASVIRPDIRGVNSLYIRNGADVSDPITGDVELVAGANIALEFDLSLNAIRISAIDNQDLNLVCNCTEQNDRQLPPCIRTINGVRASVGGNFTIAGQSCIEITEGSNGLLINDICAKPCCTNIEVERIIEDLNTLSTDVRTQGFTMSQLETRITQLENLAEAIAATGFII